MTVPNGISHYIVQDISLDCNFEDSHAVVGIVSSGLEEHLFCETDVEIFDYQSLFFKYLRTMKEREEFQTHLGHCPEIRREYHDCEQSKRRGRSVEKPEGSAAKQAAVRPLVLESDGDQRPVEVY